MGWKKTPEYPKLDKARRLKKTPFNTSIVIPELAERAKERAKKNIREREENRRKNEKRR